MPLGAGLIDHQQFFATVVVGDKYGQRVGYQAQLWLSLPQCFNRVATFRNVRPDTQRATIGDFTFFGTNPTAIGLSVFVRS